jgi:1-acyl-sn-glycerol-3-phosphate acyltransferase
VPRFGAEVRVAAPGRPTASFVRFALRWLRPLIRFAHRPTLDGVERLPPAGPFLLVANHSAGLGIAEILAFIVQYLEQVGAERPLAGFAHPLGFKLFPASLVLRHVGAIPSTYEAAEATLAAGVPLLVFPGGDHETMRPLWQAHRVDFAGRKGFLRIARKLRVPIVPMGIRGSHFTAPVLWRSRVLPWLLVTPRLLGIKRWPITVLGLAVAVALALLPLSWLWRALAIWAWLASPAMFASWVPWTIRFRIGAPLPPDALFPGDDLDAALARVQDAVQALVSEG